MKPQYMAWLLSLSSGLMLWLMGNKSRWAPLIGLVNQALWAIYAIWLEQWGLLPGIGLYTLIHCRNLVLWTRQGK